MIERRSIDESETDSLTSPCGDDRRQRFETRRSATASRVPQSQSLRVDSSAADFRLLEGSVRGSSSLMRTNFLSSIEEKEKSRDVEPLRISFVLPLFVGDSLFVDLRPFGDHQRDVLFVRQFLPEFVGDEGNHGMEYSQ